MVVFAERLDTPANLTQLNLVIAIAVPVSGRRVRLYLSGRRFLPNTFSTLVESPRSTDRPILDLGNSALAVAHR